MLGGLQVQAQAAHTAEVADREQSAGAREFCIKPPPGRGNGDITRALRRIRFAASKLMTADSTPYE
jgi:hypothetical protein